MLEDVSPIMELSVLRPLCGAWDIGRVPDARLYAKQLPGQTKTVAGSVFTVAGGTSSLPSRAFSIAPNRVTGKSRSRNRRSLPRFGQRRIAYGGLS